MTSWPPTTCESFRTSTSSPHPSCRVRCRPPRLKRFCTPPCSLAARAIHLYGRRACSAGYFLYDTLMVFADLEAEEGAAGAAQTVAHHIFVLGTLPVGLVTNTWAHLGSGVLTFWTEVTGPGLNLIWILRTTVGDLHWSYAANGLIFGVSFTIIRVFILGYHTFHAGVTVYENWDGIDPDGPDGPLEPVLCRNFIPDMTVGGHGSCQFGFWLMFGIWAIGLIWVPAVAAKVYRGASKFLTGHDDAEDSKKE